MLYRFLFLLCFLTASLAGHAQKPAFVNQSFAARYQALDTTYYSGRALSQDSSKFFAELKQLAALAQ